MIPTYRGIIILLLAITVTAGGMLWYESKKAQEDASPSVLFPAIALTAKELKRSETDETPLDSQSWQTYRNEEYGFEVKYPPIWKYEIYPDDYNGTETYTIVFINPQIEIGYQPFVFVKPNWSIDTEVKRINAFDPPLTAVIKVEDMRINSLAAKKITYSATIGGEFQETVVERDSTAFILHQSPDYYEDFETVISTFHFLN